LGGLFIGGAGLSADEAQKHAESVFLHNFLSEPGGAQVSLENCHAASASARSEYIPAIYHVNTPLTPLVLDLPSQKESRP
jgi:hypothetical protein